MKPIKIMVLITILISGANGCAMYPNHAEQKARLSRENFSNSYRVAVTTYQREADIDAAVMKATIGTMMKQSSINEALSRTTKLEIIDEAMKDTISQLLPAKAEILDRAIYGATSPILGGEIVADDAMRVAKEKGYNALFFVAVQPVLTSKKLIGLGDFKIQLLGLSQLHKVLPGGGIGGNTALLHGMDTVDCPQPVQPESEQQLQRAIDNCVDVLAAQLKKSFEERLK
jgi:hypothetical protein